MAFAVMMSVSFLEMCLVSFAFLTSAASSERTSKIHVHFLSHFALCVLMLTSKVKVKVMQSRYRPGVAQSVLGS
jgi:uncharacterized membrane protein